MNRIRPHITPARLRFLTELEQLGVGEPSVRGARYHCLKLGWCQSALRLRSGRVVTASEFDQLFPTGTEDRWNGVNFVGVVLTNEGLRMLSEAGRVR